MTDCVSQQSVQLVADELGLDVEGVAPMVAAEVELQLRYLIQDMVRFMAMSKRTKLTVQDTMSALRLRGQDGTYGYATTDPSALVQHTSSNANKNNNDPAASRRKETLVFVRSSTVNLHALAATSAGEMPQLPRVPMKPTFSIHWLGINGVQPSTLENPPPEVKAAARIGNIKSRAGKSVGPRNKRLRTATAGATGAGGGGGDGGSTDRGVANSSSSEVAVKQVGTHTLSQELKIYFEKVVASIRSSVVNPVATLNVYASVSSDPGLHKLLPYLTQFISETVHNNMRNTVLLMSVMRFTRCVLVNPHLQVELYLHQLMPAVLTCVVGKRLCQSPFEDHWTLRDLAASLIHLILARVGEEYQIQPRITKTLHAAILDKKKPLTTQYGAIVGMTVLGDLAVEKHLLPIVPRFASKLQLAIAPRDFEESGGSTAGGGGTEGGTDVARSQQDVPTRRRARSGVDADLRRREAVHCYGALQTAVGRYLKHRAYVHGVSQELRGLVQRAADVFGETLLPVHESSEGQCGIAGDVFL